jgi:mannose-6-phosphate isomerase-like protein (cupin superfamily)
MSYAIHTDVKYPPLERFDVGLLAGSVTERWWNQSLALVNDAVLRLGVLEGEFHWHHHDTEDELFYVLEGRLLLDLPEETVDLLPNQGIVVPKGLEHRTRAPERTVVLMVEAASVKPTGD